MNRQLRNSSPEKFDYAKGIASGGCMDIDMLWERNGQFLAIENKRPGETFSVGQRIALDRLAQQSNWTIWVAYGNPPDDIHTAGRYGDKQHPMTKDLLRRRIQQWWDVDSRKASAA